MNITHVGEERSTYANVDACLLMKLASWEDMLAIDDD